MVKNVLIGSECDLVSNVRYQAGDGRNKINSLAYFNKGNSDFPFEKGIVIATHSVQQVAGPYKGFESPKDRIPFWTGDPDLNDVISNIGGTGFGSEKAVAVLEFDFIPIKDSINFEYLFVSDSFNAGCAVVCQPGGALFAAWLTEIETGVGQNLALVPGTFFYYSSDHCPVFPGPPFHFDVQALGATMDEANLLKDVGKLYYVDVTYIDPLILLDLQKHLC